MDSTNCKTDAALWISIIDAVAIVGGGAYLGHSFNTFKTETDKTIKDMGNKIEKFGLTIKSYIIPQIESANQKIESQQQQIEQQQEQINLLNYKIDTMAQQFIIVINSLETLNKQVNQSTEDQVKIVNSSLPSLPKFQNNYTFQPQQCQQFNHPVRQSNISPKKQVEIEQIYDDNDDDVEDALREMKSRKNNL